MTSAISDTTAVSDHLISVVVPVYRGEKHLAQLVDEIAFLTETQKTPDGRTFRVVEVLLVSDCGPDGSDRVIREMQQRYDWVRPIWLTRNFGQHPATLAGIASSRGEWIVTLDEDGQHDPADIGNLLDSAVQNQTSLVYAAPLNQPPHPAFRRITSRLSKRVVTLMCGGLNVTEFHSFRLVLGEVGRSVAAYAGQGVYLDVALGWVAGRAATAPVTLRSEGERQSGYHTRALLSHFWRMVLTSGTRGLRLVSLLGVCFGSAGALLAVALVIYHTVGNSSVPGWTSLMAVTLVSTGGIMLALGVVAEYLGVAVGMAMGKPLYLIGSDPSTGPLGRPVSRDPG